MPELGIDPLKPNEIRFILKKEGDEDEDGDDKKDDKNKDKQTTKKV